MAEEKAIASLLGQEARRRGISHADAAGEIGVSQATFSRWVAGTTPPSARYWAAIGRFLKVSRTDVMNRVSAEFDDRSPRGHGDRIAALEVQLAALTRTVEELQRRLGQ
jgi:hypothetical protein